MIIWRPRSLQELTLIKFNMELTHLDSEPRWSPNINYYQNNNTELTLKTVGTVGIGVIKLHLNLWGMCLNSRKSTSIVVSRSRNMNPSYSLNILVCCSIKKLNFEKHIQSVASSIAQKMGILRKCLSIYEFHSIPQICFISFILPLFKYCAPVWSPAVETHLNLLDRSFNMIKFLLSENNFEWIFSIVALLGLNDYFLNC